MAVERHIGAPGCITDKVVGVAATMGSQPMTRSALAMSTLVV
jgi:hypothetical protein